MNGTAVTSIGARNTAVIAAESLAANFGTTTITIDGGIARVSTALKAINPNNFSHRAP